MIEGLLWIMGTYGTGIAAVHLVHGYNRSLRRDSIQHYVFVTQNSQQRLEGYVRWIVWLNWLRGASLTLTVVDQGSDDDTLSIAERLSSSADMEMQLIRMPNDRDQYDELLARDNVTWIRLDREEDLRNVPMFH